MNKNNLLIIAALIGVLVYFSGSLFTIISPNQAEGLITFDTELNRALVGSGEVLSATTDLVGKFSDGYDSGYVGHIYYYVDDVFLPEKTQQVFDVGRARTIQQVKTQSFSTEGLGDGSHKLSVKFSGLYGSTNQQSYGIDMCSPTTLPYTRVSCANGAPAFIGYFLSSAPCQYREKLSKSISLDPSNGYRATSCWASGVLPDQDFDSGLNAKLDRQFCVGSCERTQTIINNTVQYVDRPVEVVKEVLIEKSIFVPVPTPAESVPVPAINNGSVGSSSTLTVALIIVGAVLLFWYWKR